jgi:uncharacterized membrane protein (DUF485 family)
MVLLRSQTRRFICLSAAGARGNGARVATKCTFHDVRQGLLRALFAKSTGYRTRRIGLRSCLSRHAKETQMTDPVVDKIQKHPKYLELRRKRNVIGWSLTLLMMVVYYGYIALIAFNKPFLAQPIGAGVTSLGIPIGLGVIIFTVVITGIYVRRANGEFDDLTAEILKDVSR